MPRIDGARALKGRTVEVVWAGSPEAQIVDLSPALKSRRIFVRLRSDDALFASLRVNEDGNALEWDDGSELTALWIERLADTEVSNAEFRRAMDDLGVSLDGMAAELGIARRLVADYRKDKPIPKTVALAVRYLVQQQRRTG